MDTQTVLIVLDAALWLGVFVVHAMIVPRSPLSVFELSRRAEDGDVEAKAQLERERLRPRLETLRRMFEAVLLVLAVVATVAAFGMLLGVLLAVLLVLLLDAATRLAVVRSIGTRAYAAGEPRLSSWAEGWAWLDVIGARIGLPDGSGAASKAELKHLITESKDVLTQDELLRLQASLTLDERTVADAMTPVSVIETVDLKDTLGPLVLDGLHKTGHSRFPVIDRDVHHVVGLLYLHDIVNLKKAKATVRDAMDPRVHYIHEDHTLEHALAGFLKTHRHLFVVVNGYRETVGVLTLEDVLEALLGKKIVDEFDQYDDLRAVAESNPKGYNSPEGKTDV